MLRKLKIFGIIVLGICLFSCSMESVLPSVTPPIPVDISQEGVSQDSVAIPPEKMSPQLEVEGEKTSQEVPDVQDENVVQTEQPKENLSAETATDKVIFPSWYSEADIKVHYQTMEEAVENSVVYLINKDSSTWYYYNRIKEDRSRPYRKVAYEIAMKMICNGAFLPGYEYPSYHSIGDSLAISEFPKDSLWRAIQDIWNAILWDHPEFFYLGLSPSGCDVADNETGMKGIAFYKQREYSLEQLRQDEQTALQHAQELLVNFDYTLSTDEQLKSLFDIICSNVSYFYDHNEDRLQVYSAWGGLVNKYTCCLGYSLAYQYLAYLANVDAVVFTVSGLNGDHAWNYIQTSQGFQPVDSTVGSVYETAGWLKEAGGLSKISKEYHPCDEIVQRIF